jgi:hypothetical protein
MIEVDELPPSDFCRMRVSFESRKFINCFDPCDSLLITFESASSDLLMLDPSRSLSPSAYVLLTPSDPARSTKLSCDCLTAVPSSVDSKLILNTVCDRDDASFNLVSATFLASSP